MSKCRKCAADAGKYRHCERHRRYYAERQRKRFILAREQGKCYVCLVADFDGGYYSCAPCRTEASRRARERAKGVSFQQDREILRARRLRHIDQDPLRVRGSSVAGWLEGQSLAQLARRISERWGGQPESHRRRLSRIYSGGTLGVDVDFADKVAILIGVVEWSAA